MSKKKKKSSSCCGLSSNASKDIPCNDNYKNPTLQEFVDRLRNNPYFKDQEIKIRYIDREN